jgi:aminopeptidase N
LIFCIFALQIKIMRNLFSLGIASCLIITAACHSSKKSVSSKKEDIVTVLPPDDAITINMDTITVTTKKVPTKEVYRNANTITSDIIHTKLEVNFDWNKSYMNGIATIQVQPYFYATNKLYLNARGMTINKLSVYPAGASSMSMVKGQAPTKPTVTPSDKKIETASYVYENDSIKIDLGRVFRAKEDYFVVIDYVSKPNELKEGGSSAIISDKGLYFINPRGEDIYKMPQIWTQGETQSSSVWFPTIDSPNEKMTQEIYMTVDDKFITLSNGALVSSKKNATTNMRTDYWRQDAPHAPYLAMMAVGQFKKVTDTPWNGKEISYYVEKNYEPHAKAIFGDTKEMIEFFSKRLGVPYAWDKYAQIVARDYVSGAMENTSATLHGESSVYQTTREILDYHKGENIISHELFHQWFGDLVTCESWSNLPLNESFATYGEYLWLEYKHGREEADFHHAQGRSTYMNMAAGNPKNMVRFNYNDKEDMFDMNTYAKGGQILHMLRNVVGDDAFFASLQLYLERNKFKSAEIHNLRLAFEEVTGQDLNWFFNQWFMAKGHPILNVSQTYNADKKTVELTVEQTQNFDIAPLYRLPVSVDVYVNGVVQKQNIVIEDAKQTFTFNNISSTPDLVNFDANRQLLCALNYVRSVDALIYQYQHAPLYGDRADALKLLKDQIKEERVLAVFKTAAEKDASYHVRTNAIRTLEDVAAEKEADLKPVLLRIANSDKTNLVRAEAFGFIAKYYKSASELPALIEKGLNDPSYAVEAEALQALIDKDPTAAMQKAKQFENETGKGLLGTVASLYSTNGGDEQLAFFGNNLKNYGGFELIGFLGHYARFAKRSNSPIVAITAAHDFESIAKSGNRFSKMGAVKSIKDLAGIWETKATSLKQAATAGTEAEKKLKETEETRDILKKIYADVK